MRDIARFVRLYGEIIDRTGAQTMLYLTCTMASCRDLAHYGVSRAKDWVSADCGTTKYAEGIVHYWSCASYIILPSCNHFGAVDFVSLFAWKSVYKQYKGSFGEVYNNYRPSMISKSNYTPSHTHATFHDSKKKV